LQKSGACLIIAEVQTHPVPIKSARAWQNPKYTFEGCHNETRADMRIPSVILFMWVLCPSFDFAFW
jgi:hypothetical protein